MNFRAATSDDCPAVQELVFSILQEYGLKPDPQETDWDLSHLREFYFDKGGYFEVGERDGKVIGTWGLLPLNQKVCELRKMYLLPSERGRGVGKNMLLRCLKKARELGFERVELETASVLNDAIQLYEKFGFKKLDHPPATPRCDQAFYLDLSAQ